MFRLNIIHWLVWGNGFYMTYTHYYFCFHGAALQIPQGRLLLPGISGSGKSTLSAVLTNKQNPLYSDELIALNSQLQLLQLNLPLTIKSGSWEHLQGQYPELVDGAIWQRLDGRQLKYVWPQAFVCNDDNRQVCIVNPYFDVNNEAGAEVLSVIDALLMLTSSGYQLGMVLTEEKIELLIDFISAAKCYKITYKNTDEALALLQQIWAA